MFKLGNFGKLVSRSGVVLKHVRPEIFTTVGVIGVVIAGVWACKKTIDIIDDLKLEAMEIDSIKAGIKEGHCYDIQVASKDIQTRKIEIGKLMIRSYGPPVALGACSIGLIVGGHRILRKENAALGAAVTGLTEAFKKYRQRVVEDQGREKDREYSLGKIKESLVIDSDGNEHIEKRYDANLTNGASPYFRWFEPGNPNWKDNPRLRLMFLKSQQNYANDLLHARGHLFLNEVYDMLGLSRTKTGQLVGWVDGNLDSFVDFGIVEYADIMLESNSDPDDWQDRVPLDFNVDGYVLDLFNLHTFQRRVIDG